MSDRVQPERRNLRELTRLVRALGEELAGYRRRALTAEARLRSLDEQMMASAGVTADRVVELERENAELRRRVDAARLRAQRMLHRVRFLRQQRVDEVADPAPARGRGPGAQP